MRRPALYASAIVALAAAPVAGAQNVNSLDSLANLFVAADLNNNSQLSRNEYLMLRTNVIDRDAVGAYRGDRAGAIAPSVERSFAALDRDSNGYISRSEFMNIANDPAYRSGQNLAGAWNGSPEFVTVSYYLTANPIDTDELTGDTVVNLQGERIGELSQIVRSDDDQYYAVLGVTGQVSPPFAGAPEAELIGVPLEDVLFSPGETDLYLSSRGEEYLMTDLDAERVDLGELEPVDRIYGL